MPVVKGASALERVAFSATLAVVALSQHCKRVETQGTRATSTASTPRQPVDVPPAAKSELLPLEVGQWIRQRAIERGRDATRGLKIVGKESGRFWFEVVTGAADAGTVVQILMDPKDRRDRAAADIRVAKVRMPNGFIKELTGPMLEPSKPGYRELLDGVFMSAEPAQAREDVTVPAGTFRGCYRMLRGTTKFWIHPAVPLTGVVKSESEGATERVELLDFGLEGAVSELEARVR
jgi:hypothetical protein